MKEPLIYSYKGYEYRPTEDIDYDDQTRKYFHTVYCPDDKPRHLPLSPRLFSSQEFFELWVDAGCPYPYHQRISIQELKDMIFTNLTEAALENIDSV